MAIRSVDDANLTAVADAIRAKAGTSEALEFPAGFVCAVDAIQAGGSGGVAPSAKWDDVTFIDYDGTVLHSYSISDAQALTDLPALPTHDGFTCQGWNWTLEDIKALNRPVTVGAMYITDDGATRLHIRIATTGRMTVPLYIGQTVANGVSIDWGDGSTIETLAGTGNVNTTHTYAVPGDYVISLMPDDGCTLSLGSSGSGYCVLGSTGNAGKVYCNMLQAVYVGKNVTSIGTNAVYGCQSLATITIPYGVTSIGNYAIQHCYALSSLTIPYGVTAINSGVIGMCYSLASVAIPDGVASIGAYAAQNCYALARLTIPDGVTAINSGALYSCYALASVAIPDGVASIGSQAFYACYGIRCYDFTACTSVPTLSNTNAFSSMPSDCEMLIPAALYDEWSAATNWAAYTSYMVAV